MLGLVAMIIGAVLGAWSSDAFGAFGGAALGWLLLRSYRLERRIAALQDGLKDPKARRPEVTDRSIPARASIAVDQPPTATSTPAARPWTGIVPRLETPTPNALPPKLPPAPGRDLFAPIRGWLFGGNTIVKVGVGLLFTGLAFLAKYASEHIRVPVEVRLAMVGTAALVLLAIGWRLRLRRPGYAQVLQGGAVAVLYLTLFVAFRFFGVLAVGPVFVLMVLVAALSAALAVLQDAPSLAAIGALGGFATPLLVSTGSSNYVALFSYYLVLDLGIAAVAWHRTWRTLNLIGFVGTFVVGTGWGVLQYQSTNYAAAQGFLIAFFLLFSAIMLMPARHLTQDVDKPSRASAWVNGSLLFGLPTVSFALQYGLVRDTEYGTAISALVLAGFYVVVAMWVRSRPQMAVIFEGSLAVGAVFLTLVIPFALDARSTAGGWALEGAGLVWLGFRQSRGMARAFGYGLLALAGGAMLVGWQRFGAPSSVFNATFLNALMAGAAALAAALFVRRFTAPPPAPGIVGRSIEPVAEPLLIGLGTLWLVAAASVQINTFVPGSVTLAAWLATFSGLALLHAVLSARFDWPRIGKLAIGHAPLHAIGMLVTAATGSRPFEDGGWWAWPLAVVVHLVVLRRLAPSWATGPRNAVHALGVLVLAGLGALQGRAITAAWGDPSSAWPWLGWLVAPAALLIWLPRPASVIRWPLSAAPAAYQSWASGVLAMALLLWTLLANAASNGSAAPLPHLPLINPLDLGVGLALLAVWLWIRSEVGRIALGRRAGVPTALFAIAGFVWLNAVLLRAFYHYGDVPYQADGWTGSPAVQTGIALLWAVTALVVMWLSARRALRLAWMGGAALLAAVVLKLLVVDLAGTGTVTRIISFIGVGVLMLVIGYVAPLPTKGEPLAAP